MNDQELTQIDLFSGIGGFSIAGQWAGFRTIVFCEKDEFCQKVLKARFGGFIADSNSIESQKESRNNEEMCEIQETKGESGHGSPVSRGGDKSRGIPIISEIQDFDGTEWRGTTILTGGFPCQPFSVAGPRTGKEDDRYLWPEMLRVIGEARPHWVLGENVAGIKSMEFQDGIPDMEAEDDDEKEDFAEYTIVLDEICSQLEGVGYEVQPIIIPACAVNAPHRRDRVWIVANSKAEGLSWRSFKKNGQKEIQREMANIPRKSNCSSRRIWNAPDSFSNGYQGRHQKARGKVRKGEQGRMRESEGANSLASDPKCDGWSINKRLLQEKRNNMEENYKSTLENFNCSKWQEDWYEVATRLCRVDDGLPSWIHSDRVKRLKALGNAIVPQIAYEIMKNIAWMENERAA